MVPVYLPKNAARYKYEFVLSLSWNMIGCYVVLLGVLSLVIKLKACVLIDLFISFVKHVSVLLFT